MIVLDENLHDERLMKAIAAWHKGRVVSITSLRAKSVIKDEAIPTLLRQVPQPTFVTINVSDFWRRVEPHAAFCIVTVELPVERIKHIPRLLQRLFRLAAFKTKAARMGKVVRLSPACVDYYEEDRRVRSLLLLR
ncbi:MAG: hypothetical protein HY327_05650 [Chloroflexi bacterium]|nr:hypothetical protein [Chloroflexota bacterium]